MFDHLEIAPPDPILGLEEAFKRDANPAKINLAAGVYRDETGNTPVFRAVKRAEADILETEISKTYLSMAGLPEFTSAVQQLVFGAGHSILAEKRATTVQTPGGTAALRVAGDFIKRANPNARIWVSNPTWPNHPPLFRAAGLSVETYPYFDPVSNCVDFDALLTGLERVEKSDIVLLHGSCHNPTGADLAPEQWGHIAALLERRGAIPLIDFAYQGFGRGLEEDARGVRTLVARLPELIIATSYSKNFGLYNERTGALTIISRSQPVAEAALSQVKIAIRQNYSNPPAHGAKIVSTVLNSPELTAEWELELDAIRKRIRELRRLFVEGLHARGVTRDFSCLEDQNGMFSYTGLTKDQVARLKAERSIYIVDSGRINVAGLTTKNLPTVCEAIAAVL
jgi:aspartate aminotransferase/aromatic-amino-acid transaminase